MKIGSFIHHIDMINEASIPLIIFKTAYKKKRESVFID